MRVRVLTAALVGLLAPGLGLVARTTSAEATATTTSAARTAASAVAVPTPPAINWKKCKDSSLRQAKAQCGMLTVPLDYVNPTGATIKIAVSRVLHTKKNFKGAVFTNPGGPGGEGLTLSRLGAYVPKKAGLNYDWYGVDPRGVGQSEPALGCDPSYPGLGRKPYEPSTSAIESYWLTKTANYATACANSPEKALLPYMKTTDNVMDFESLRVAIGQPQITWYGFSYGTYIGQVYATMYPTSLKAVILDGVVDPTRVWYAANLDQDLAFQKAFTRFEAWMAKYDSVYHLGKTRKQVDKTITKATKKLAKKPALHGKIGPAELNDTLVGGTYYNFVWPDAAQAVSDVIVKGDGRGVKQFNAVGKEKGVPRDNGYAVYTATQCADAPWPTDYAQWKSDANAYAQNAPLLTWNNTWYNMPCRTWSVPGATPTKVVGTYTGPVLLTSEQYDPATPFSGALTVRSIFPNSALVEGKKGTSHAISLDGVSCIDDAVTNLLKNGTLPTRKAGNTADKSCRGLQPPDPTSGTASRPAAARPVAALFR